MSHVVLPFHELCAWRGQSLLATSSSGACDDSLPISGYYFREARFLRTLRLQIDGHRPWLCEPAVVSANELHFAYVYPEVAEFGGGGTGQSQDAVPLDRRGLPQRAIDVRVRFSIGIASLDVEAHLTNRSPSRTLDIDVAWVLAADFADIQEALGERRQQTASVTTDLDSGRLGFAYDHDQLKYRTRVGVSGPGPWSMTEQRAAAALTLDSQQTVTIGLHVEPVDYVDTMDTDDVAERDARLRAWRDDMIRVRIPGNTVAETTVMRNIEDIASFPLMQGARDEWLTPQAGMPPHPAPFWRGRVPPPCDGRGA